MNEAACQVSRRERLAREVCAGFYMMRDRMPRAHPEILRIVELQWETWLGEAERLLILMNDREAA